MSKVAAIGDVNVDVLMSLDRYPSPGEFVASRSSEWAVGGSACNTAIALRRLGLDVAMIARVGADPLSSWALDEMRAAGVDVQHIRRDDDAMTGLCVIPISPDGERTMFTERGANARICPDDIPEATLANARWVHLSGYMLLQPGAQRAFAKAVEVASRSGVPVSVDVGIGPTLEAHGDVLCQSLPAIDVLLSDEAELEILTDKADPVEAARALQALGISTVIVKRGGRGCWAITSDGRWTLPAFEIEPVDATGAGDAFSAGIVTGRIAGLSARSTILLANVWGAMGATVQGAGASLPGRDAARRFIANVRKSVDWADWQAEFDALDAWLRGSA